MILTIGGYVRRVKNNKEKKVALQVEKTCKLETALETFTEQTMEKEQKLFKETLDPFLNNTIMKMPYEK